MRVVRSFLGCVLLGLILVMGGLGFGQVGAVPLVGPGLAAGGKTMLLWPDGDPGAMGTGDIDKTTFTVYLPSVPNATRTGVVIAPGGSYMHLAMGKEGSDFALW